MEWQKKLNNMLTIKTPQWSKWLRFGVFIVNLERIDFEVILIVN